jgi:hypothetical protein
MKDLMLNKAQVTFLIKVLPILIPFIYILISTS